MDRVGLAPARGGLTVAPRGAARRLIAASLAILVIGPASADAAPDAPFTAAPRVAPVVSLPPAVADASTEIARKGQAAAKADPTLAKTRFGAVTGPTSPPSRAIGRYGLGCLAGAAQLAADGPHHTAMRLTRNRRWGHPDTIAFVEDLAEAAALGGLNGILVGDISQPRGGPMLFGHSSHQVGLDVDIWFALRPDAPLAVEARETKPFESVLNTAGTAVDPGKFTPHIAALVREAASDPRVARVFVHPHIKKAMCDMSWPRRGFLRRIRPWYGHDEHFHVRLKCPGDSPRCAPQSAPPKGTGCGAQLHYWYTPAPWTPDPKAKPKPPLTVARMPLACQRLLEAPDYAAAPVPTGQPTPVPPRPQ